MMMNKKDPRQELLHRMIQQARMGQPNTFCIAPYLERGNLFLLLQNMKFYITSLVLTIVSQGETVSWTERDMPFAIFLQQGNFLKEADAFSLTEDGWNAVLTSYDADTQFRLTAFAIEQDSFAKILGVRASFQAKPAEEIPTPIDGIVVVTKNLRIIADWQQQIANDLVNGSRQEHVLDQSDVPCSVKGATSAREILQIEEAKNV